VRDKDSRRDPSVNLSNPFYNKAAKGRCAMTQAEFGGLPRGNPCAQCGRPIAMPEWIETYRQRTAYLWHCHACDYRFEAVAYFDEAEPSEESLAA
jgi:ribosomal protein L34E